MRLFPVSCRRSDFPYAVKTAQVRPFRDVVKVRQRGRLHWGDLIYDGSRPVLVISWRTMGFQRIPYIRARWRASDVAAAAGME